MKRLLLLLLCLTGLKGISQDYIPMLNDSSWYLHFEGYPGIEAQFWCEKIGDTIIEDIPYAHYQENYTTNTPFPEASNDYYIREDIEERRVYRKDWDGEHLLYDFSLEVGDEVIINSYDFDYTLIVAAKDSFAVDAGRKRVRLTLLEENGLTDPYPEYWIEGLGSLNHPFKSLQWLMPDSWYTTLCNHYGEEIPYSVNQFQNEPFTCPDTEEDPEEPTDPEEPDDYIPLLNDTSWHVAVANIGFSAILTPTAVGEIVFDGNTYLDYQENLTGPDGQPYENHYYIREEIDTKRVYKYDYDQEYLLYDFGLEVGDEVTIDVWGDPYEFTVISKDSFAVDLGRKRVKLTLQHGDEWSGVSETWIEGIGNLNHPLVGMNQLVQDPTYTLLCQNYAGTIPYMVDQYNGQPYTCGSEEDPDDPEEPTDPDPEDPEEPEEPIEPEPEPEDPGLATDDAVQQLMSVYPNPFSESFIVTTNMPLDDAVLTLHDMLGRIIREMPVNGTEIRVSRDNLPKGIYMLRIRQDGKLVASEKLIAD